MRHLLLLPIFLGPAAFASRSVQAAPKRLLSAANGWFYAAAGDDTRQDIDEDGILGGVAVWRTGEVMVGLTEGSAANTIAAWPGVQHIEAIDHAGLLLKVDLGDHADDFAVSRALREVAGVEFAHPNLARQTTPHTFPNDPYVHDQWHLENVGQEGGTVDADIDAEAAWAWATGAGVLVSVVDTGVDADHPDLRVTCGYNYIEDTSDCYPADGNAHGTAAAGIIAAIGDNGVGVAGVAYDADIYGIRLVGGSTTSSDLYEAFTSSADAGAAVINNSWGFGEGCSNYVLTGTMQRAFAYADQLGRDGLGTVIVFSAGNYNCDMSTDGIARYSATVSVSALDHNDRKESYSNYGQGMDVGAPSGGILTTDLVGDPGYGNYKGDKDYTGGFSGTSASAPVVSGVFALMFEANPDLTAADARAMLQATADKALPDEAGYDSTGWSPVYGYGRVNAAAAVIAVANERPTAPVVLGPLEDPYEDRVWLQWEAATDADGDPLTYTVTWTVWPAESDADSGDTGGTAAESETHRQAGVTATYLDITSTVDIGTRVEWSVATEDAWVTTEATEAPVFTVQPLPTAPEPDEPEDTGAAGDTPTDDVEAESESGGGSKNGSGCSSVSGGAGAGLWLASLVLVGRRRSGAAHLAKGEVDPRT